MQPAGGRNATGEYDPRYHGFKGNLSVSLSSQEPTDFDKHVLEVPKINPHEFPYHIDMSSGRPLGLSELVLGGGFAYNQR